MNRSSILDDLDTLRRAPTTQRWSIHLRRLQRGELDEAVRQDGGFEDHISSLLEDAEDPPASEALFIEAFGKLVQSWQPNSLDRPEVALMFVDLIAAYTPAEGYIKLYRQLLEFAHDSEEVRDSTSLLFHRDIRRKILGTLDAYFPISPPKQERAYRDFLHILSEHLERSEYAGYAATLLFRREALDLRSEVMQRILTDDPEITAVFIDEIFVHQPASRREKALMHICDRALGIRGETLRVFITKISEYGGSLNLLGLNPSLIVPGMKPILLRTPDSPVSGENYFGARWADGNRIWGTRTLPTIRKQAREEKVARMAPSFNH